jgi:type II secretory pathway component GspD/PulD (secretin)
MTGSDLCSRCSGRSFFAMLNILAAAYPGRNALVIVDRGANVRRLVEVIKILENLPKSTVEWPPPKTSEKP